MKNWTLALFITFSLAAQSQVLKLGLITDCQYCNCPYSEQWNNDYSKSPLRLKEAVNTLNSNDIDAVFHLGDFIDRDFNSFDIVGPIFNSIKAPHYHLLGNHDYSVSAELKPEVQHKLNMNSAYFMLNFENWMIFVLDGTDVSLYKTNDSAQIKIADSIRIQYLNQGREQAMPWNGAIGEKQLNWLDSQLTEIDKTPKNALILCHFPIYPAGDANLWNDKEVITILEKHASVKAFINGHHHPGNYAIKNGIHYLTLQGMVLSENKNSFAIGHLSNKEIAIKGFGREPNRVLKISTNQ